jgi:hypothetical protein
MAAARALRSFLARDGSPWDWAGALLIADAIDDLRHVRIAADAYTLPKKHWKK